jgi:RNA polymerase sigma-70 factor (ECF subfamily)
LKLLDSIGEPLRGELARLAELDDIVATWLKDAETAWPALHIDRDPFWAHIARHIPADALSPEQLSRLHASDLYLAYGCTVENPAAQAAFEQSFMSGIDTALLHMRLAPGEVDEVRQLLRQKVLVREGTTPPKISSYSGVGPLKNWIQAAAIRTALNLRRSTKRESSLAEWMLPSLCGTDEELERHHIKRTYRKDFKEAIEEAICSLDAQDRLILRQHFIDGLTGQEIGALHGVNRVTIFRWIEKAKALLATRMRRSLVRRLGISAAEVASLGRVVESQLEVSFSRLLAANESKA